MTATTELPTPAAQTGDGQCSHCGPLGNSFHLVIGRMRFICCDRCQQARPFASMGAFYSDQTDSEISNRLDLLKSYTPVEGSWLGIEELVRTQGTSQHASPKSHHVTPVQH